MKIEEFDDMLAKKDKVACLEFFVGMPEKERKELFERAKAWYLTADAFKQYDSPFLRSMRQFRREDLPKAVRDTLDRIKATEDSTLKLPKQAREFDGLEVYNLALMATGNLTELRKFPILDMANTLQVMEERKPRFLDKFLDLACEAVPVDTWLEVRRMELNGLTEAHKGSGYLRSMVLSLGRMSKDEFINYVKEDRAVVDDFLWKMFEEERAVRVICDPNSISNEFQELRSVAFRLPDVANWSKRRERWINSSKNWHEFLAELVKSELVEVDRLLDICFAWLHRLAGDTESKATNASSKEESPAQWFCRLHDCLELSDKDKDKLATKYLGLLTVKDGPTLCWSLNKLDECSSDAYDLQDLLDFIPALFSHKRKDPPVEALKLLERLLKDNKNDQTKVEEIAKVVLTGFSHSSADVHKRSLAVLKRTGCLQSDLLRDELRSYISGMNALVKKDVLALCQIDGADVNTDLKVNGETIDSHTIDSSHSLVDIENLLARAKKINRKYAKLVELDTAIEAVSNDAALPGPLVLDSSDIPRLYSKQEDTSNVAKPLEPIDDFDDLLFLYSHVLEGKASADDIERVLDGLSRLCHLRPDDFESRTSSLHRRSDQALLNTDQQFAMKPFNDGHPMLDLAGLARVWIEQKVGPSGVIKPFLQAIGITFEKMISPPGVMHFFSERTAALAQHVAKGQSLPLLAAPTHSGGWIDPLVLPKRINQWQNSGIKLDKADFIQAVLRLAPDNRSEALKLLPDNNDEYICALRYALGDQLKGPLHTAEIWTAAFRCREPKGSSELLGRKFGIVGPDVFEKATYRDNLEVYRKRPGGMFGTVFEPGRNYIPFESSPQFRARPGIKLFPTELLHDPLIRWEVSNVSEQFWLQDRESYFVYMARRVAMHIDSVGTYWQSSWECIFDPDISADGYAVWLIALALSSKQPESARLALDVLISCIDDCRIDGRAFGQAMAKLIGTERITLTRWAKAFKETNKISLMHSYFIYTTLEHFIAGLSADEIKSPPIALLEILYEACTEIGASINLPAARTYLEGIEGKGKAAKLAKLLLELKAGDRCLKHKEIAALMLESRLARAERWQRGVHAEALDGDAVRVLG